MPLCSWFTRLDQCFYIRASLYQIITGDDLCTYCKILFPVKLWHILDCAWRNTVDLLYIWDRFSKLFRQLSLFFDSESFVFFITQSTSNIARILDWLLFYFFFFLRICRVETSAKAIFYPGSNRQHKGKLLPACLVWKCFWQCWRKQKHGSLRLQVTRCLTVGEIDVPWPNERKVHNDSLSAFNLSWSFWMLYSCILVIDNMFEYDLRPLLLHKCHSMCMYRFTLIMTFSSFIDMTKQAIKCVFLKV